MKNMDRREYLKRMAIAAGGVGLARMNPFQAKGLAENIDFDRASLLALPEACPTSWPCTTVLPDPNSAVRLIFAGMVAFTYKMVHGQPEGRVVFHRGDDHHRLKIIVYQGSGANCVRIYENDDIPKDEVVIMDIRVNDKASDAKFFMNTTVPFKREDLQGDDKDFRWLLDLEGPDLANRKLHRKQDKFRTKLKVRNGVFYTYRHTGSTFKLVDSSGNPIKNLGYVPKVMAANIPLRVDECLSFKIRKNEVSLPHPICGRQKYEIFFLNEDEERCLDRHDKRCLQGDFTMVYAAIEEPLPFDLKLDQDCDHSPAPDFCGPTTDLCLPLPTPDMRLNDEAPCMGGGFGGGGGFP